MSVVSGVRPVVRPLELLMIRPLSPMTWTSRKSFSVNSWVKRVAYWLNSA